MSSRGSGTTAIDERNIDERNMGNHPRHGTARHGWLDC